MKSLTPKIMSVAVAVFCMATLTGCQQDDLSDLKVFVDTVHKDKKPSVEPLPEIKPIESYQYSASNYSDPFNKENLTPRRVVSASAGVGPNQNRRREPLESFPLDSLIMVGSLFREGERRVILKTPKGAVRTAKVGNYLGQNFGKITEITENEVKVSEQVLNSSGLWIERDAAIKIKR